MRATTAARTAVFFALSILALGACGASSAGPTGSPRPPATAFEGPRWSAIAIRGGPPVPGHEPTIQFVGGHVGGTGGCNQYSGDYRYDEATGRIELTNLAMTAMGCLDQRVGSVEAAFAEVIGQANRLALDPDGRLHLSGPAGEVVLAKMVEG